MDLFTNFSPVPTLPSPPPFRPWRPPAEPGKPPFPYRPGFTVDIKSHVPPAPFGGRDYGPGPRTHVSGLDLHTLTQTEIVMANPPIETADPSDLQIHSLSVIREIAVVDGRGAQLALCTIKPKGAVGLDPFQAVAKIYDPLYYSFPHKDVPSAPCDVTWFADVDYSREAAAYEHLEAIGQAGSFAPKYFGSWTFSINFQMGEATPPKSRPVRLILIEHVPGKSIRELCAGPAPAAATFNEAYRLEVLARILDGEARLRFEGIDQRHLTARHVILHDPPDPKGKKAAQPSMRIPRVVLVDYSFSIVFSRTVLKIIPSAGTTLPPNPMWIHWSDSLQAFRGWIPAAWETNPRLRQEWLEKRFGGDNLARYAPFAKTTTRTPSPVTASAPPRPHGSSPRVMKEVAPPPKAVKGETGAFPVDFWGDAAGKQHR